MKTQEERNAFREEVETINKEFAEQNGEELVQAVGGQVVDPTRPGFGQETCWDLICSICGANFDTWWGPVPENGYAPIKDCPACGGKACVKWERVQRMISY